MDVLRITKPKGNMDGQGLGQLRPPGVVPSMGPDLLVANLDMFRSERSDVVPLDDLEATEACESVEVEEIRPALGGDLFVVVGGDEGWEDECPVQLQSYKCRTLEGNELNPCTNTQTVIPREREKDNNKVENVG